MARIATVEIEVNGKKKIVNADDSRARSGGRITRESIASMKKAELVELLEAHGAKTSGPVMQLRDRLIAIMFVDV